MLAYHFKKEAIKKEVRSYLRANPGTAIGEFIHFTTSAGKVNEKTFSWVDKHEFMYHGEMYDVISVSTSTDHLVIHCIKDKDENALNDLYQKIQKNNSHSSPGHSLKFFSQVFFVPESTNEPLIISERSTFSSHYKTVIPFRYFSVNTPPPDFTV
jgi:hypothetical protein